MARTGSRGAHTRLDYPNRDDAKWLVHTLAYYTVEGPRLDYIPVTITRRQPAAREYQVVFAVSEGVEFVEVRIRRYDPDAKRSYVSIYKVPFSREQQSSTCSTTLRRIWMGICGSCAVNVNSKPMLACYMQVLDLNTDIVTIEPLSNLPAIKDLVVDIQPFFQHFRRVRLYSLSP